MENIINELNSALALISTLSVSGDAVDIVALAKQKIRVSVAAIKEAEENTAGDTEKPAEG